MPGMVYLAHAVALRAALRGGGLTGRGPHFVRPLWFTVNCEAAADEHSEDWVRLHPGAQSRRPRGAFCAAKFA